MLPRTVEELIERLHDHRESHKPAGVWQLAAWDREIDELVYELYGLTEEEIRIVEG